MSIDRTRYNELQRARVILAEHLGLHETARDITVERRSGEWILFLVIYIPVDLAFIVHNIPEYVNGFRVDVTFDTEEF